MTVQGLEQRALLVSLEKSCWPGQIADKDADASIRKDKGNKEGTTKTTKWLVAEPEIKKVHKAFNAIYLFFTENTLPWEEKRGGARLANGPVYQRLMEAINTDTSQGQELGYLVRAAYAAARDFAEKYPELKEAARADLNGLWQEKNYPPLNQILDYFKVKVTTNLLPLSPESLTLKFLGNDELTKLKEKLAGAWERSETAAMADLYKRLAETVGHVARKLADPKAIFRDTLVTNVQELADLIPQLNFKNDPELAELAELARGKLANIDPEVLRTDLKVRGQIAGEAGELLRKITGAGGRFIDLS
jgi:hypothetical protein